MYGRGDDQPEKADSEIQTGVLRETHETTQSQQLRVCLCVYQNEHQAADETNAVRLSPASSRESRRARLPVTSFYIHHPKRLLFLHPETIVRRDSSREQRSVTPIGQGLANWGECGQDPAREDKLTISYKCTFSKQDLLLQEDCFEKYRYKLVNGSRSSRVPSPSPALSTEPAAEPAYSLQPAEATIFSGDGNSAPPFTIEDEDEEEAAPAGRAQTPDRRRRACPASPDGRLSRSPIWS
ncbi:hypothetical protein BZA05DRAFT_418344 [Tricharina praecox]|uniref:uncharacterized protein n=1 Tax=Tricharina praecox TaxID=43433 RepID=UPI002220F8AA|nr:uncharacterized protein BZA05DRAFT_418344 [Tricharina praecox]KAI5853579.1 hypothetical protein BZA05DRAFT_418344 [Tricharina praecox]